LERPLWWCGIGKRRRGKREEGRGEGGWVTKRGAIEIDSLELLPQQRNRGLGGHSKDRTKKGGEGE